MEDLKALLPWEGGRSLLACGVSNLLDAGYDPVVVVVGHEAERLTQELPSDPRVTAVFNPRYAMGRTTSIVVGVLEMMSAGVSGFVLASVDQPRAAAMLRTLREAFEHDRAEIVVPALDGKPGHPPLFHAGLIPELLQVTEEPEGLRQVMRNFADERVFVPVDDPLTLVNLNTKADYEAALRLL